jgi:hypothetical protein
MRKLLVVMGLLISFLMGVRPPSLLAQATANGRNYFTVNGVNKQTSAYTVQPSDNYGVIVANCSSACAITLYGSPWNGFTVKIVSQGSTVATVSLNSKNGNGSSTAPVLISFWPTTFVSDGTNYFYNPPPVAGSNIAFTPAASGLTIALSGSTMTNPMTTLGDIIYENSTPAPARLAGNTTSTKYFLTQTGTGTISAVPAWGALASGDIPNNAANTTGTAAQANALTSLVSTTSTASTASIAATNLVSSASATYLYHLDWEVSLTAVGVACTGSTLLAVNAVFTDPNTSSATTQTLGTITLAANGVGTVGFIAEGSDALYAKTGTAVQYSTTLTAGTGCSTNPAYQVVTKLW